MRIGTRVLQAGMTKKPGQPFLPGITFAGTYHAPGEPSENAFTYGRFHNPTWTQYENALSELEGGTALCFASGMAAMAAIFGTTLRPGETIVLPSDSYYTTRLIADGYFAEMGINIRKAPTAGNAQAGHLDGAKLLLLETPSNPGLDVCDIAHLAKLAHEKGALVAVDNTTPTMIGQSPLALGADFSVASDTKSITGHGDLILGHVAVRDAALAEKLRAWRTQFGAVPGPMEVWLAHRSLATLEMRLDRQCRNALAIAGFLKTRSEVTSIRYPGLLDDPSHEIAKEQMQFYGPVVSFVLPSRKHAEKFLSNCRLIIEATSFGSVHTMAERRARWGGDVIPEGFIRFSAGCEDIQDLLDDLTQALNAI